MRRSVYLVILLVILCSNANFGSPNDGSRFAMVESLLNRGEAFSENSPFFNIIDAVYSDGHYYSDKPPVLTIYSAGAVSWAFPVIKRAGKYAPALFYYSIVLTSSGIFLLLICHLLNRAAAFLGVAQPKREAIVLGAVLASCLLPFAQTYNDHIPSAALIFGVFYALLLSRRLNRKRYAVAAGGLLAITWHLHPFVGSVFFLPSILYFLTRGRKSFASFFVCSAIIMAAGFGLHQAVYKTPRLFYFSPEKYFFTYVTDGKLVISKWAINPTTPGLTRDKLITRLGQLRLSPERVEQTLKLFDEYRASIKDGGAFVRKRFHQYDYLLFNPLMVFVLILAVQCFMRRGFPYRLEYLWAAIGIFGLYAGAVYLRSVPGASFGNRHLLPVVPLLLACGAPGLSRRENGFVFKTLFWISFAMMLPGTFRPWFRPVPYFLKVNQYLYLTCLTGLVLYFCIPTASGLVRRVEGFCSRMRPVVMSAVLLLFAGEFYAYFSYSPTAMLRPRTYFYAAVALMYVIWRLLESARRPRKSVSEREPQSIPGSSGEIASPVSTG